MPTFEYSKIDLATAPNRSDDVALLTAAGTEGWELVCITNNGIAYFKRTVLEPSPVVPDEPVPRKRTTRTRAAIE